VFLVSLFHNKWNAFKKKKKGHNAPTFEELVPIRLNIILDGYRIQDTFTWNLHEQQLSPEQFAESLCADLDAPEKLEFQVSSSIRRQLESYGQIKKKETKQISIQNKYQILSFSLDWIFQLME